MKERVILHCDLNSFYAGVECIHYSEYKSVPMAVCGDPNRRHGIILAKNEPAKAFGIKTAETIWQAKRKCPNLILVPPRHDEYHQYYKLANEIYLRFTDLVEPFGIDESWLDVTNTTHLFGDGKTIADKIRNAIREELNLTVSVGVSFNKIFAKLGSDYQKPDATTVITHENLSSIVYPLPVSDLLFVGSALKKSLLEIGVTTIGQLAAFDRELLVRRFGVSGGQISDFARGLDESPVASAYAEHPVKSIGNGTTFTHDLSTLDEVKAGVAFLTDSVATRMRRQEVKCQTVQVSIKNPGFVTVQRQKSLTTPTNSTRELTKIAMSILIEHWTIGNPIRTITITASNLTHKKYVSEQLSIFDSDESNAEKEEKMDQTMDKIRQKYGKNAIYYGNKIKKD